MPVFVGKVFTATEAGQRLEGVTCEKCGTAFHYELTRVGVGKGSAPYLLGQASAAGRAGSAATRDLAKRLNEEAELVPCPKCHWVNQDLVDRYRRRQYRRAPLLIVVVVVAGFVAAPILAAGLTEAFGYNSRIPSIAMLGVMAVCLLSPAWVLLGRRILRRRIDPNITYPRRPNVPPGTPPALIEERDPQSGDLRLVPVAATDYDRTVHREWAMFRPGQVQLPPVCCMCLSPAATVYRSPLKVNENSEVEVPLCEPCGAQLRRRWWLVALAVGAVSVVVSAACAALFPYGDAIGRWGLFGILGFFAALIGGVVIASRVCQPYRMKVIDTDRGIVKFAASNPAYTAMLVQQVLASDGIATR